MTDEIEWNEECGDSEIEDLVLAALCYEPWIGGPVVPRPQPRGASGVQRFLRHDGHEVSLTQVYNAFAALRRRGLIEG